jgi:SlyX protein
MSAADANPGAIEQRLTELEVRLSFIDDAVQNLDATVAMQNRTLAEVVRALERLRNELAGMQAAGQDARDEPPPPHY